MTAADFDAWRAAYPTMSFADHQDYGLRLAAEYPDQFSVSIVDLALYLSKRRQPLRVIEVGGWKGEVASLVLCSRIKVESWTNYEIVPLTPRCEDPRYQHCTLKDWVWNTPVSRDATTAVLSHVIEHLSREHVECMVDWVGRTSVKYVYVEAPITPEGRADWTGCLGTHILDVGWDAVEVMFRTAGFNCVHRRNDPHHAQRWFAR